MKWLVLFGMMATIGASGQRRTSLPEGILAALEEDSIFQEVHAHKEQYHFELLVSFIDRRPNGKVRIQTFATPEDDRFFYAASVVKLPLAIATMEKFSLHLNEPVKFDLGEMCGSRYPQRKTSGYLLENMLVYSDNPSYNALYDLVGRRDINQTMRKLGMKGSRISRRFLWCTDSIHGVHPRARVGKFSLPSPNGEIKKDKAKFSKPSIGYKHWNGKIIADGPRDFSQHNYIRLDELHQLVIDITTGKKVSRFLGEEQHKKLLELMAGTPDHFGNPSEQKGLTKMIFFGENSQKDFDRYISFNIIGMAYGFMTESTYLCDLETGNEVIISMRGYFNKNNILGDDVYEYYTVGYPLFQHTGEVLLERASNRNRQDRVEWRSNILRIFNKDFANK